MPPFVGCAVTRIGGPNHQMRCANDDFVVASGTPVNLGRTRSRDRPHLVFV